MWYVRIKQLEIITSGSSLFYQPPYHTMCFLLTHANQAQLIGW